MIKISKTYHLAHQVRDQHSLNRENKSHLQSLPSYIKEQEGSHRVIPCLRQENIFLKSNPVHLRRIDLNSEVYYKFVGLRQLRSYQSRAQKKKRNLNSINRKSVDTAMSISRVSSTKTAKQSFLTKEELIKKVFDSKPLQSQQKDDEILMEEKNSYLFETFAHMEITGASSKSKQITKGLSKYEYLPKASSLSKIKGIMKKYEDQWDGFIKNRTIIQKKNRTHKKYQSVLQNVVSFRENIEVKQKNDLIEKNAHIKPEQWKLILRNQKSLQDLHEKQLSHACAKGLKVTGTSKSTKQMEWLQKKDKEGCFFKYAHTQLKRS